MLDHVSLGVRDLGRAGAFYDPVLGALGYVRLFANARGIGYGRAGDKDEAFAIVLAGPEARAAGAGSHLAFSAPSRGAVDAFHAAALTMGGLDEGAAGLRPHYGEHYYAAFVRDLDGHRIEAVCHRLPSPPVRDLRAASPRRS